MASKTTPRYEIDYQKRLQQRHNAIRKRVLPVTGYKLYRVYDIKKEFRGIQLGFKNIYQSSWQQALWQIINELESLDSSYDVRWLKAKHVTLLQMKGHCVEPAKQGDTPSRVERKKFVRIDP